MKKYVIDTNFIVRYFLADNKEQYKKTKKIFDDAREGKVHLLLEQSVFVEVIFVLSSFYKIPKDKITNIMLSLLSYKGIETETSVLQSALEIFNDNTIHIVDAIVIARYDHAEIQPLTIDKKLEKIIKK